MVASVAVTRMEDEGHHDRRARVDARVIGTGRAATSFTSALSAAGWSFTEPIRRGEDVAGATHDVDVVLIATSDDAIADVAAAIEPDDSCAVVHLSGSLGPGPLAGHSRRAVVHPLVALPDGTRGAARLVGAWFGVSAVRDPVADRIVTDLDGRVVEIADDAWACYHAAAAIAANHLVALLGQAERVGAMAGLPLAALMDLARGSLEDVAELGPAEALTGPVRRGDTATIERHLGALPADEREAYRTMSVQAARLLG